MLRYLLGRNWMDNHLTNTVQTGSGVLMTTF